ncbi:MAG TPA: M15 family metallopeptidase [Paludibacter sp.]
MNKFLSFLSLIFFITFFSCSPDKKNSNSAEPTKIDKTNNTVIVDCHYTFEEAIAGSKAPKVVIQQLQLINVHYYSTDGKIHVGQILTNREIAEDLLHLFDFMLQVRFPIAKAIPIIKYNWNDNLSMQDNNTYSFCYRNTSYSKHAYGMAIDINPYFNPIHWKNGFQYRQDKPLGAVYNQKRPGTFYQSHPVVLEFKKYGLRWGHNFSRNYDDHHFEK